MRKYFIAHDYAQKWSEQKFVIETSTLHLHPYILNILPASSEIGVSGDILQRSWHTHHLNSQSGIVLCGSWQRRTINYNNLTTLNNIKLITTLQMFETVRNLSSLQLQFFYSLFTGQQQTNFKGANIYLYDILTEWVGIHVNAINSNSLLYFICCIYQLLFHYRLVADDIDFPHCYAYYSSVQLCMPWFKITLS